MVGNKVDLCPLEEESSETGQDHDTSSGPSRRKREVTTEEAELWAQEEGLLFVEASAKSGVNVEEAFERATRNILEKVRKGVFDDERVRSSSLIASEQTRLIQHCPFSPRE